MLVYSKHIDGRALARPATPTRSSSSRTSIPTPCARRWCTSTLAPSGRRARRAVRGRGPAHRAALDWADAQLRRASTPSPRPVHILHVMRGPMTDRMRSMPHLDDACSTPSPPAATTTPTPCSGMHRIEIGHAGRRTWSSGRGGRSADRVDGRASTTAPGLPLEHVRAGIWEGIVRGAGRRRTDRASLRTTTSRTARRRPVPVRADDRRARPAPDPRGPPRGALARARRARPRACGARPRAARPSPSGRRNARAVRVVGDFNSWDGAATRCARWAASGIWELFVPGHRRRHDLQVRAARPRRRAGS